jgi:23S rRNA-/tRNA-specific pseudouridylate synthase
MTQPFQESENPQRKGWVVYEDDWLLVVNKPAGLLTIPTHAKKNARLSAYLMTRRRKSRQLIVCIPATA